MEHFRSSRGYAVRPTLHIQTLTMLAVATLAGSPASGSPICSLYLSGLNSNAPDGILSIYKDLIAKVGSQHLTDHNLLQMTESGNPFQLPISGRPELIELQAALNAVEQAAPGPGTAMLLLEWLRSHSNERSLLIKTAQNHRKKVSRASPFIRVQLSFSQNDQIKTTALSPDGKWLVLLAQDRNQGEFATMNVETQKISFGADPFVIASPAVFSPDGTAIYVGHWDKRIWRHPFSQDGTIEPGAEAPFILDKYQIPFEKMRISSDQKYLFVYYQDSRSFRKYIFPLDKGTTGDAGRNYGRLELGLRTAFEFIHRPPVRTATQPGNPPQSVIWDYSKRLIEYPKSDELIDTYDQWVFSGDGKNLYGIINKVSSPDELHHYDAHQWKKLDSISIPVSLGDWHQRPNPVHVALENQEFLIFSLNQQNKIDPKEDKTGFEIYDLTQKTWHQVIVENLYWDPVDMHLTQDQKKLVAVYKQGQIHIWSVKGLIEAAKNGGLQ